MGRKRSSQYHLVTGELYRHPRTCRSRREVGRINPTFAWLREYVDIDLSPEELAHRLTMAGTEVGSVDVVGGSWDNVFVGYVTSSQRGPAEAHRQGRREMTVVFEKVPFAKVGARLIDSRTQDP